MDAPESFYPWRKSFWIWWCYVLVYLLLFIFKVCAVIAISFDYTIDFNSLPSNLSQFMFNYK